jgi:hypothetical protein
MTQTSRETGAPAFSAIKPQPRLERQGQDGQHETEKPDHPAS